MCILPSLIACALWRPLRAALGLCPYVRCSIVYHPPDAVLDGCGHWSTPKKAIVGRWADSQPTAQFRLGQAQALPCGLQGVCVWLAQLPGHNAWHMLTPPLRARRGPFRFLPSPECCPPRADPLPVGCAVGPAIGPKFFQVLFTIGPGPPLRDHPARSMGRSAIPPVTPWTAAYQGESR